MSASMKVIKLWIVRVKRRHETETKTDGGREATNLRRLGDPLASLRPSLARVLDSSGHANFKAVQRSRVIHLNKPSIYA